MAFDGEWFDELRGLSQDQLQETRARGIGGLVPHVGELCRDGHISDRFLDETTNFVHIMSRTGYRFNDCFRAYPRHVVNWPPGRAFRKQWNIGCTAGDGPGGDFVRIGLGFRLSAHENSDGILDYLQFREQVGRQQRPLTGPFRPSGITTSFGRYAIMQWVGSQISSPPMNPLWMDGDSSADLSGSMNR